MDQGFPFIEYKYGDTFLEWGLAHGEAFRESIRELANIRQELMLNKNPLLKNHLAPLAQAQWDVTKDFAPHWCDELEGIRQGANLSLEEIVILNNYTDFRDIELPEEGCSTMHIRTPEGELSGQTWDMHQSAKDFLCLIRVPETNKSSELLCLSLVGCPALMGINTNNCLVGVNNINTQNAKAGIIWPVFVRALLEKQSVREMDDMLKNSPVTSGHNYIVSDPSIGEHWEVTPNHSECVGQTSADKPYAFHTNHCLGDVIQTMEMKDSISSTTHKRFELLTEKANQVRTLSDLKNLFQNHDNYPMSLCSHYESGAQDPSTTCGGGIANLSDGISSFWRGCPTYDDNYKEYHFTISDNAGKKTFRRKE